MASGRRTSRSNPASGGRNGERAESDAANSLGEREQRKPRYDDPRYAPLAPSKLFRARVLTAAWLSLSLVAVTLAIGMAGYHWIESLSWLDAFHQAALLLSGMGPVVTVETTAGKVFDGLYALFCGVALLATAGILLAPIVHRIMHRFHLEDAGQQ